MMYKPYLWLIIIYITGVCCTSLNKSKVCSSSTNVPYTGYKIENQINLNSLSNQFYLVYCRDNKLIYSLKLNDSIPWTVPITFSSQKSTNKNKLILARRKTFALRSIPLYLPQTLVGALFHVDQDVHSSNGLFPVGSINHPLPLVADNIFNNWIQTNYKLQMILHVPILSTPNIDNRKYVQKALDWAQYISPAENYLFAYDSRMIPRKALDVAVNKADSLIKNRADLGLFLPLAKTKAKLWKFILLTKVLLKHDFQFALKKLDTILSY